MAWILFALALLLGVAEFYFFALFVARAYERSRGQEYQRFLREKAERKSNKGTDNE